MKQIVNQIGAVLMAFVVLFTTMSFTVNMHYCGDLLVDFSLTNHAKSCGMEQSPNDVSDCELQLQKKSCCSDKELSAKAQENLKPAFHDLDVNQQLFITSFLFSYALLFEPQEADFNSFEAYLPPPLIRDVQTLDQVFRI
ncbi:HYC_CC_PP family protein [Leeuwenhoekiella sp. H156]|uniref:HYC_CC_PP family protein n=1 Tax=Leeuwenhoekiella sp. H156 TaxID=3450128 RepID=UPI003FA42257